MSDGDNPTHGLLDTNTVKLLPRLRDPQQLPPVPAITTVSGRAVRWSAGGQDGDGAGSAASASTTGGGRLRTDPV